MARLLSLLAGLALLAGCTNQHYSRMLIQPNSTNGKTQLKLLGSSEQLIRQHRIDEHRQFAMADGTVIDAWIIRARANSDASRGTMLLLHGLDESKAVYVGSFAGPSTAQRLADKGYDVVIPDLPGHGESTGYVTYGALEKHYLREMMDQLSATSGQAASAPAGGQKARAATGPSRPLATPFYVFGQTLGGAVALQYAAFDERVQGVMAVASYRDARSAARLLLRLPAPLMSEKDFNDILAQAGQTAKFDPDAASSVEAVRKLHCPVVLVHGLLNLSVPLEMSGAIYDAANDPRKLIVITPGPEQLALGMIWDAWVADQMELLATQGAKSVQPPSTQPGGGS